MHIFNLEDIEVILEMHTLVKQCLKNHQPFLSTYSKSGVLASQVL